MVGVEKWLSIARIEQDKVLFEELAHNISTTHIAQKRCFGRRKVRVLNNVEADLGRQNLAILQSNLH